MNRAYRRNGAKIRARNQKWRRENPEVLKLSKSRWFQRWYAKPENRAKFLARGSRWWKQNRIKARGYSIQRRLRIVGNFSEADWQALLKMFKKRCAYCGKSGRLTLDHKTPLSRGGAHTKANIVPACVSCNSKKRDKTVSEFKTWLKKVAA